MAVYRTWLPVVAHVLVELETDEPLTRKELRKVRELAERFADEGDPILSDICDTCGQGLRLDLASLNPVLAEGDTLDITKQADEG